MKVVYLYDGTPYLAELNEEGEYDYPKEAWTETPPPEGIYEPFYFNGNQWIGSTKEEWEANKPPYEPTAIQMQLAQTQMQLAKTVAQVQKSQQELANCVLEGTKKDERIKKLEEQQAQAMLEIAKLKGEI